MAREVIVRDIAREIEKRARASHWPTEEGPVVKVEIELQQKGADCFSDDDRHGYRVRKVEWYDEHHFKKYGLSWKTGEWMLVPEVGGCYPEETFLEVKPRDS
jgi:hypothetical protein